MMLTLLLFDVSGLCHWPCRLTRNRLHLCDVPALQGLRSISVRLLDSLQLGRMLSPRRLLLLHVPVR
jgi:hypothetical protein